PTMLNAAIILPGWTPVGSQIASGAKYGAALLDDYRGERNVLVTQSGRDRAARFVRDVTVSKDHAKLVARVGREDDAGWTLRVLADGALFASEPINKETAPDGWRTLTIDLAPLVGKAVTLAVDQSGPSDKTDKGTKAYWKRVAIE
ncbi:MAG: hypothetical protein M3552_20905, partial [Planctomycetota bacterium]|nr:hypothetical protein [Planctomycetota bacterium]